MDGSSLSVWMVVLFLGMVAAILLGIINPYVPKSQKMKAKVLNSNDDLYYLVGFVYYKKHLSDFIFVIISTMTMLAVTVSFIIESFSKLAHWFGGGVFGIISTIILMFLGMSVIEVSLAMVGCVVEDTRIEAMKAFYEKHFRVMLLQEDEIVDPN